MRAPVPAVLAAVCLWAGGGVAQTDGPIYRPEIQPIGWSADGERVRFVHSELYGGYDYADFECGGSGVYETDGRSPPAPVATGETWCARAAGWMLRFSLSADAGTVFLLPGGGIDECTLVSAFDLTLRRWNRTGKVCGMRADELSISPEGSRIAGRVHCERRGGAAHPPGCSDPRGTRIVVTGTDGSQVRVLGESGDRYPAWSPDGRSLSVMTEGGWNIVIIDVETGARRMLTQGNDPAWSPDGQWLAFTHFPKDRSERISLRIIRRDGTGERTVFEQDPEDMRRGPQYPSPGGWPRNPLWSPDGERIVFTKHFQSGNTLWIVNADGTGLRQLAGRIEPVPARAAHFRD